MLASLRHFLAKRRFKQVARALPMLLSKYYGGQGIYTSGQVRRAATDLKLDAKLVPSAFAIACDPAGFLQGQPGSTAADYLRLRTEFAQLFGIGNDDFTLVHVRHLFRLPTVGWGDNSVMNSYASGVSPHDLDGGSGVP